MNAAPNLMQTRRLGAEKLAALAWRELSDAERALLVSLTDHDPYPASLPLRNVDAAVAESLATAGALDIEGDRFGLTLWGLFVLGVGHEVDVTKGAL